MSETKIISIAACGARRELGLKGGLPWTNKEDLKWFREKTVGSIVIMGRLTFESLNGGLKDRINVVVTSKDVLEGVKQPTITTTSLENAIATAAKLSKGKPIFIIGGYKIFQEALEKDLVDVEYITFHHKEYEADTFYPYYERDNLCERTTVAEYNLEDGTQVTVWENKYEGNGIKNLGLSDIPSNKLTINPGFE
ncbi:MAG: dihydrofolate reductase [Gammaproteobacteria bacterium]|nr:dihydrofolate reductase [Gammaproteobacteria bacterium]